MACAIELYKLDKGYYPEKIDDLEKEFPNDIFAVLHMDMPKLAEGTMSLAKV